MGLDRLGSLVIYALFPPRVLNNLEMFTTLVYNVAGCSKFM